MKNKQDINKKLPRSDVDNFKATYENYEVACPICKKWNVFNRITDIKSTGAAMGKTVACLHCKNDFRIIADDVEEKYEYFLEDYEDLLRQKKYMYCILTLCQACEAFFMKCVDIKLLWEPYRRGVFGRNDRKYRVFKEYYEIIHEKFKSFTFKPLLNIVFDLYLNEKLFSTQDEILNYIQQVKKYPKNEPNDEEIRSKFDEKQQEVLLELKKLHINEMRNNVVHKDGYRPKREDVEHYYRQVITILNDVVKVFNIGKILRYCQISNVMELVRE